MPEKFIVDGEAVRGLAKLLEETGLTEIEYQVGTQRVRIARGNSPAMSPPSVLPPSPPVAAPQREAPMDDPSPVAQGEVVPSPMVGTVYLSPEPGTPPFIKVGDVVQKGDTLLIIEAMKVMNPIRAPRAGKVLKIYAIDTKPVEFGEPLVILE